MVYSIVEKDASVSLDEKTRQYFDERATGYYKRNYERPHGRHGHNLALRRDACLGLMPAELQGTVLDLGCGPGAMTVPLVQSGKMVVSVDLSREMVEEASRQLHTIGATPRVAVADATALPFADGSFSAVITTGVLEYISDLQRVMSEIHRVLRPGGVVVATMSLPRRLERAVMRTVARLRNAQAQAKQYIHTRKSFDVIVSSAGLKIELRTCCGFAPFPLDAVVPDSVPWIDHTFGSLLNKQALACDQAKTYIVRARRPY